jgi:DNA-binding MarR family transcriptional regulator
VVAQQPESGDDRGAIMRELIEALREFTVESDVFVEVFARTHGLGRSDLNAIMWISFSASAGRPMTAGELAGRLGLGAPATTALVDRLESAGHVRRTRDPGDRRRVTITMEPRALKLATEYFVPLGGAMADAVAGTSDADLRRTAAVVRMLISAVTQARLNATDGEA